MSDPIGQVRCPYGRETDWPCQTHLQPIEFEGQQSLAAGVASHLQTVHGLHLQAAWRLANSAVAERAGVS